MAEELNRSTMNIDLRVGDSLDLGGVVRLELVRKSGQCARLRLVAPRSLQIKKEPARGSSDDVPSMAMLNPG